MANSSDLVGGEDGHIDQYNNLRADVLDETTGHTHAAAGDGKQIPTAGIENGAVKTVKIDIDADLILNGKSLNDARSINSDVLDGYIYNHGGVAGSGATNVFSIGRDNFVAGNNSVSGPLVLIGDEIVLEANIGIGGDYQGSVPGPGAPAVVFGSGQTISSSLPKPFNIFSSVYIEDTVELAGNLEVGEGITQKALSADPADPADGYSVKWLSDGTGSGDAGDVMMKITVGATTKTITLVDFSAS